jgi:hypothetical protein
MISLLFIIVSYAPNPKCPLCRSPIPRISNKMWVIRDAIRSFVDSPNPDVIIILFLGWIGIVLWLVVIFDPFAILVATALTLVINGILVHFLE